MLKKMLRIFCSIIVIFSLSQLVFADTTPQTMVSAESFSSESEARRKKCEILTIKDEKLKSAILQKVEHQTLMLTIYDRNDKGEFVKSDQICIPSWYGMAKVEYKDLLGDSLYSFNSKATQACVLYKKYFWLSDGIKTDLCRYYSKLSSTNCLTLQHDSP